MIADYVPESAERSVKMIKDTGDEASCIAADVAQKNIRVNCVCPGVIRTPMVERAIDKGGFTEAEVIAGEPIGRLGQPQEIAEGVIWLLSDASSFVTGHPLTIDGGWIAG